MVEGKIIFHALRDVANPGLSYDRMIKLANDADDGNNITIVVIFLARETVSLSIDKFLENK